MRVRPLATLSVVAVALLALAGCSSAGSPSASGSADPAASAAASLCDSVAASGAASDAVSVTGDVGSAPTVTFTAPLDVTGVQATTVVKGTGPAVADGDYVTIGYAGYDPATGKSLADYKSDDPPAPMVANSILGSAFGCGTVGSRAVITVPAANSNPAAVYVIDLLSSTPAAQWCQPQAPASGAPMPTVTWDDKGVPTVTVPSGQTPPTSVTEQVLTEGDGDTVQAGDSVTLNYHGIKWSDGTVFDSSWTRGQPATFTTSQVVAGFGNALVGQKVGSQLVVVIPPECGYGTATTSNGLGGQTLVFVISLQSTARG
ncbi:FKBP-type peptidyl-prolyl cis-trans isomerase [Microbacterium sp. SORGH_AS_0888]|uniref:FKBP-type peptidyl-prolyl cis-trans isomerase n=1 Tax=Microbacterium sp. SORGH_AS_0888 TaxID=3041791 RepID=UPI00278A2D91|nr:FKBP-type peptidyl-prolyl cis-trans isomerase [Microbacterium sp. SORGH_AS_0888]MDQ1128014.1 FKBP-type peptidyl-prolyl cis-trans isomerase [Microbacterium sp. SORGH_AS_0888]